jgi:hypothetical protein
MIFGKPKTPLTPEQQLQRRQNVGVGLAALSESLRGGDPVGRTLGLQQQLEAQQQQAEQDKLNQELNAAIDSSNIPESQKTFIKAMGVQQKYDALYGQKTGQRKIIKAADGYNYYADTGERVLPGVKKDKMSYGMKQDVNSYWRYTEGPMKGQRVFPDVSKEKEEEEKEPYNIGDEDKLRDDYRSESKEFVNVRNAFGRILSVEPTAAGDLSLIFNYMKMLDPGSVVRESEYENAAQSGAFGERVKAAYLRYKSGERLTESMREDFKTQANNLYQTQSDNQSYVMEEFKNLAEEYGMKPSRIVQNYGSPIEDKLLEIKLKSLPLNELATLDLSQYSEKQLDIIKKVIKSKGKQ